MILYIFLGCLPLLVACFTGWYLDEIMHIRCSLLYFAIGCFGTLVSCICLLIEVGYYREYIGRNDKKHWF